MDGFTNQKPTMKYSTAECTIPEFFAGKVVFLTGGSGFMGKVLAEKILRSCPKIACIYMLLRDKKGMGMEERAAKICSNPFFDRLKKERPGILEEKLKPISGDVMKKGLGISEADRKLLTENVTLIFHVAASVRFDQPLKEAILMNTRGTAEVCRLALECKNLKVMMHVSTAYCQCDKEYIDEIVYPPHADWRQAIEIAEEMDIHELEALSPLYMNGFPNTYTFTKSLAESVVHDLLNDKVPNIILRPSIVISTKDEPIPGWIDNFNGPVGILLACGTGLIRVSLTANVRADYVPVDSVIKSMLIATWAKATKSEYKGTLDTTVFNSSTNNLYNLMTEDVVNMAILSSWECPLEKSVWYPSTKRTTSNTVYYLYVWFFHLIPGLFFDGVLKLMNYPPSVLRLQRTIHAASLALKFFTTRDWMIENTKLYDMELHLLPQDTGDFSYKADFVDIYEVFANAMKGAKQYLLKENPENNERTIKRYRMYFYLDILVSILSYILLIYVLHYKLNVFEYISNGTSRYLSSF